MTCLLDERTVETSFHVRFAETDSMGIVHHANYLVWFEEARSAFLRALGTSYTVFEVNGLSLAVSELNARYIAPARYDRLVSIQCRVEKVQSRKIVFSYLVLDKETQQTLVTGVTHHLCLTADGQVTRLPMQWQELFRGMVNT